MSDIQEGGDSCECYLTELKWNFCCLFFVGMGLPIFIIVTLSVAWFVYELLLRDYCERVIENTELSNLMGPRLCNFASWPPLATDRSSQNLGLDENVSSV